MLPVIEALAGDVRVSIDTVKPAVARAAVAAGRHAGQRRVGLAWRRWRPSSASAGSPCTCQGDPGTMQRDPRYDDVVAEVTALPRRPRRRGRAAGVDEVWIDPGIGFGKTLGAQPAACCATSTELVATGYPVVVGTSRKRFLGAARRPHPTGGDGAAAPADDRLEASRRHRDLGDGRRALAWSGSTMCVQPSKQPKVVASMGVAVPAMKGKWAQGHQAPQLRLGHQGPARACASGPGGYGANHRRVRRQEEIIWIREQGFGCVISLIPSPHNLHNYDELGRHLAPPPVRRRRRRRRRTSARCTPRSRSCWPGDQGAACTARSSATGSAGPWPATCSGPAWSTTGPQAISIIEQITHRQLGPVGRELVAVAASL